MKRQEALAAKNIFEDARRLHTLSGLATGASGPHNLLSPTHSDTQTVSPTRGDLIVASSTPDWTVLTVGAATEFVRSDGTDPSWSAIQAGDLPNHASRHEVAGADLVNHDNLTNFVANEHIDHTTVSVSAGTGLTGGGTIAANRTISLSHLGIQSLADPGADRILFWDDSETATGWLGLADELSITATTMSVDHDLCTNFVANEHIDHTAVTLTAGNGLTGGGDISASRSFVLGTPGTLTVATANGVTAASHTHTITSSSNPGAAASILATDANGDITVQAFYTVDDIYLGDQMRRNGDTNTYINGDADQWEMWAGGVQFVTMTEAADDTLVFNEDGVDIDTRIEAVGVSDALFVQGSDGQITLGVLGAGFVQSDAGGVLSSASIGAADLPSHTHSGAGQGGTVDHGALTGRADDDHTQYPQAASTETISGSWTFSNLTNYFAQNIVHDGDADTLIEFSTDRIDFDAGGATLLSLQEGVSNFAQFNSLVTIGVTSNANMTLGLTVDQGSATDEALALKANVAHGATDFTETDTFFRVSQMDPGDGTAMLDGFADSANAQSVGVALRGFSAQAADTSKSPAARGLVEIAGYQTSGTSIANTQADGNVCVWWTYRGGSYTAILILDEDGDLHLDGSTASYDEENDIALVREMNEVLSADRGHARRETRIEQLGIVRPGNTAVMVSQKKRDRLIEGTLLQLDERLRRLEARV